MTDAVPGEVMVKRPVMRVAIACWSEVCASCNIWSALKNTAVPLHHFPSYWQNAATKASADKRFVCTHQTAALFCVKWRHGCGREMMTSIEIRLRQSIRRRSIDMKNIVVSFMIIDLKRWSLRIFWTFEDRCPNKRNNNNTISSDMISVPDLKAAIKVQQF